MNRTRLIRRLITDEGEVGHAYQDSEGYWTIGVGRLIDKRKGGGINHEEAVFLLNNDIDTALRKAQSYHWFEQLNDVRQEVIVNMVFNLGSVDGFKLMRRALDEGDYEWASQEMLDSLWANQVGNRALRLSEAMRTGDWRD